MKERNNKLMKKLDRYIGCPLLFTLGLFRNKRIFSELGKSPRIMLLKTAAIGDTIMMDAVVKEIKEQYPNSMITFVCSKSNVAMTEMLENIDDIVLFQMSNPIKSLRTIGALGHFDLLLDFGPWPRINGIIAWWAKAGFKIGFKRKQMYRHYIYDAAVEHRDDVHEIENYRNILRAAQFNIQGFIPELKVDENNHSIANPYVIFHVFPGGSSVPLRSWDNINWIEIGQKIYKEYGYQIIFSGGPENSEEAENLVNALRLENVDAVSIAAQYPLKVMPSILAKAQLVISVNTGIMHMSAAVHVPLIALHGATSDVRWGPLSDKAIVVKSGESCQPCISLGFESTCQKPICMQHISVGMVWDKVTQMLGKKKQR